MNETKFNIAVLIDGDNAQAKLIKHLVEEVSKYGKATKGNHFYMGKAFPYYFGGINAVHYGHFYIGDNNIGLQLLHQLNQLLAIGGIACNFNMLILTKSETYSINHAGMVIGNNNANGCG